MNRTPCGHAIVSMAPRKEVRYNERTSAERWNGRFKDEFGGRYAQVRDPDKVMRHAMLGIITLFAGQN